MSSESSDTETENTGSPPDIVNTETTVANNLLPEKSKRIYEKTYKLFMVWKMSEEKTSMSEDVLLEYFEHLSQKFNPATLWTYYSMLKNTLSIKHKVDLRRYSKLTAFLKRKAEGYKAKKSKTFSPEEINRFLNEANDKVHLQSKVIVIFGVVGACRRQELYNLQFNDVKVSDTNVLVTIRNTKLKTDRAFTITGSYSDLCKKYVKLRPSDCSESSFFLNYFRGKCGKQRIGINKLGHLGKTIAIFLDLPDPERYTGHCFRRTNATLLAGDISNSEEEASTLDDHRERRKLSSKVAKGYTKLLFANEILKSNKNKEVSNINEASISNQERGDSPGTYQQTGQLHTSNVNHVSEQETHPVAHATPSSKTLHGMRNRMRTSLALWRAGARCREADQAATVKCTVCPKNNKENKDMLFFVYPSDPIRRKEWLNAVGREDLLSTLDEDKERRSYRICEEHFEKCYISKLNKKLLLRNAFPTLNLPTKCENQCRFCGEFSKDCVAVSGSMPYLAANKTTLTLNHTSVQLDFNNHSLPNTVCRDCDAKLKEIANFLTVVKDAQDKLINVAEESEVGIEFEVVKQEVKTEKEPLVIKTEYDATLEDSDDEKTEGSESEDDKGVLDSLTVGETVFVKKSLTHKRKSDAVTAKPKKIKGETCDRELIIDIKEEVVEKENGLGQSGVSNSDVKPSELNLETSVFESEETSEHRGYRSDR